MLDLIHIELQRGKAAFLTQHIAAQRLHFLARADLHFLEVADVAAHVGHAVAQPNQDLVKQLVVDRFSYVS
jgi:hypothetical protein